MYKKLFVMFAALGLIAATSCTKEEIANVSSDSHVQVSFTVPAPEGSIATRAIGDGTSAKKLYWAVYDENDALLPDVSSNKSTAFASTTTDGKPYETVNIRLVKGQSYTVVFWAQNVDTDAYTIAGDNDLTDITVNYTGAANDEKRDAFFGKKEIQEVTTDASYTVTLKRPFAQVNVGVDDEEWTAAVKAGVTVAKSSISFTNIANKFDAFSGEADGAVNVDYSLAEIIRPVETLGIDLDLDGTNEEQYNYLTMAYILADATKGTTDAVLGFEGTDGENITLKVNAMPYERNYRTNIIGHILTSSNDFKVIIDKNFDTPNYIVKVDEVETFTKLADMVGNMTGTANATLSLAEELTGDRTITLPAPLTDGQLNFNFDEVDSNATLTINDENDQYTGQVIISVSDDTDLSQLVIDLPNATVTIVGGYSAVTATTGGNTLIVDKDAEIESLTINKGNVIINGTVEAITKAQGYTGTITMNTDSYDAFAKIKDAVNVLNLTLGTGEYKQVFDVTGGKTINIAAAEGADVKVAGIGHESNGNHSTVKVSGITIDNSLLTEGWFTGTSPNICPCVGAWGGNLSFEDCTFIVAGTSGRETGVMTWWITNPMSLSFDNCTFVGLNDHASARAMQIYGSANMEVNNCTFNTYKDYTLKYVGGEGTTATFNNNTVNNSENFVELGSAPYAGKNYKVEINNTTYGTGVNPFVVANNEGQTIIVDGEYYATNSATLTTALKAGATEVSLLPNTYVATKIGNGGGKTLTLRGLGEGVILDIDQTNAVALGTFDGSKVAFENMTLATRGGIYKGFARMEGTYNNCKFDKLYFTFLGSHTFTDCTFDSKGEEHCVWTYGANNLVFDNCKFTYTDRCINTYTEGGAAACTLTCDDCTFTTANEASKGAIEINSGSFKTGVTVNLNNCKKPAYGEMVFISGWDSTNGAKATVTIDGEVAEVIQQPK